jgi:hypothetical protein
MKFSYKQRIHAALWELILDVQKLGISIEVLDPRMTDSHGMWGCFDSTLNKITIWKEADEPITTKHVATLAHELEHVHQFHEGRYINYWLLTLGFLPNWNDTKIMEQLEIEADDYAKAFLVKHRLRVPEDFDRKRMDARRRKEV